MQVRSQRPAILYCWVEEDESFSAASSSSSIFEAHPPPPPSLLYINDCLCRFAEKVNRLIPGKLRADVVHSHMPEILPCVVDGAR